MIVRKSIIKTFSLSFLMSFTSIIFQISLLLFFNPLYRMNKKQFIDSDSDNEFPHKAGVRI